MTQSFPTTHRYAKTFSLWTLLCLLLITTAHAFAQSDLNGYWNLRTDNHDGTFREIFFSLEQNGSALTGKLYGRGASGVTPLEGTFKDGAVHLSTVVPAGSTGRPTVYDGTFADGKFQIETHGPHNTTQQGEVIRATKEAALPPAPLPLPAPRDLPDNGLARTPPMGWNSWNKFAGRITDADVRGMADAMVSSGMAKLGYIYINIDDTWQGTRDAQGNLVPNTKFPDMKALADYVHSKGLKIGIYSGPGPKTCALYEGSFGHEEQDAKTYATWGIDYLKYDLCSARYIYPSTEANHRGLYQKMGEALENSGRPIVYSLCQYGENDPWKWGDKVSGNLWRTTGDINDTWARMDKIGFSQLPIAAYNHPGHWNDPDMLEVGNGGMTTDEYRTHMSLWALLSAPLIAGNDLRVMSDDTKSILMNTEVIAIDQDPAAKPVQTLSTNGNVITLWRPMQDGSIAVGIFNRGSDPAPATLQLSSLPGNLGKHLTARDLWKHEAIPVTGDTFSTTVPTHGVVLLQLRAAH
jgi:alpha-galactosidase